MVSDHTNNWQFSYNLQLPQIYINTDLCKYNTKHSSWPPDLPNNTDLNNYIGHRGVKSKHELPSQQTRYIENKLHHHTESTASDGLQWHHVLVSRSGVPQNKQLVLSWSRLPQESSEHMAHLSPTSASMLGWHQILFSSPVALYPGMVISSGTGHQNRQIHQNCPYPLICQNNEINPNLEILNSLNSF